MKPWGQVSAAKEMGANLVVKGSIRRDEQNVQLMVNLIDAKDLRQIGSAALEDRYETGHSQFGGQITIFP